VGERGLTALRRSKKENLPTEHTGEGGEREKGREAGKVSKLGRGGSGGRRQRVLVWVLGVPLCGVELSGTLERPSWR